MAQLFSDAERHRNVELGFWRTSTFLDDFDAVVAAQPDKVAIISHRQSEGGAGTPTTYAELAAGVDRLAAGFVRLGLVPGDVVSVQLPNTWEFAAIVLACARVGLVVNPLVPIFRARELRFILDRTEAKVAIVPSVFRGFDHAAMFETLQAECDTLEHVFVAGSSFEAELLGPAWEQQVDFSGRAIGPDDLYEIQFTSGTTGEPKGVQHTPNTVYAGGRVLSFALGLGADDVTLMASTLAHQTGFLYGLVMPLCQGQTVVYQDIWDPNAFCDLVEAHRVTFTMGATPFVMDSVASQQTQPRDLSSLRFFACGGAPIPPHLVESSATVLGCELVPLWGMTENGAVTTTSPGDPAPVVTNSDGVPAPWMEVRVVNDTGHELGQGEIGHLQVRGANQTPGYFKRPDLYADCLSPSIDGGGSWFETGDLAWMRDDGGIRIAGRSKDLIIRGGENVPVVEIESVLYTHPKVKELAVVGVADERLGERACAVVVPEDAADPPTLAELTDALSEAGTAKQFWPERLVIVSEMPKTPSGKIQKFQLRQRLANEEA